MQYLLPNYSFSPETNKVKRNHFGTPHNYRAISRHFKYRHYVNEASVLQILWRLPPEGAGYFSWFYHNALAKNVIFRFVIFYLLTCWLYLLMRCHCYDPLDWHFVFFWLIHALIPWETVGQWNLTRASSWLKGVT